MPSLIDIRRRIRSVKNTQQITKAMKMVSAAKLRRAQDRVLAARPYAQIMQRMLENVAKAAAEDPDIANNPLRARRARTYPAQPACRFGSGGLGLRPARAYRTPLKTN